MMVVNNHKLTLTHKSPLLKIPLFPEYAESSRKLNSKNNAKKINRYKLH